MLKSFLIFILMFPFFQAFANCEIEVAELNACAEVKWVDGPYVGQYSKAELAFFTEQTADGEKDYIDLGQEYDLKTFVWMIMEHHQHGGRPITLSQTAKGIYSLDKIFFMGGMKGQWQLRFQLLKNQQVAHESIITVFDL